MTKPRLIYFDASASRGEECRLALHTARIDFEDVRVKRDEWPALKPTTPFGGLPILELPGRPPLAQSNAILVYVGRQSGLHPKDDFEAARHEAVMCHVEDLRANVGPTLRITDEAEKKKAREALASSYLPVWGERAERQIGAGPFFAGDKLSVVDFKLYMAVRWFARGTVDHVPSTIFTAYPKLTRLHDAVEQHPSVKAWYGKS
jgi:glutathione S-transferase